jgi:hypothetical protein
MARNNLVEGMDFNGDHDLSFYGMDVCMGKHYHIAFPFGSRGSCVKTILELVHIDLFGPILISHGACQNII